MIRRAVTAAMAATLVTAALALTLAVIPSAKDRERGVGPRERLAPRGAEAMSQVSTAGSAAGAAARVAVFRQSSPPPPSRPSRASGASPLTQSPGYYPPSDPESASVRLGRREAPEVPYHFDGGGASMEEFGRLVVAALNARDDRALHSLRVTRDEFEKILWREFPESRPVTNIQAEDAWSMSEPRSLSGANRAMGLHGGRSLRFLTIEAARVQPFTNFLLHHEVVIVAVDEGTAEIHRIRLAPSVAERKGRFKALLYRD